MWLLYLTVAVFLLFVAVLLYVFTAPLYLEVNTYTGLFQLRFHQLVSARLTLEDGKLLLRLYFWRWQKDIDLLAPGEEKKIVEQKTEQPVNTEKKRRYQIPFRKVWAAVKSIRINKLYCTFDTGDMPTNGLLYPVAATLSTQLGKTIVVNFLGENELILELELRIYRLVWAFLRA